MTRSRLFALYLAILAAWMQVLAPVAMAKIGPGMDPFSIICAHRPNDSNDGPLQSHRAVDHGCCALCHAQLAAPAVDARPAFTRLDYPLASPLRWRVAIVPPTGGPEPNQHRPRGPPRLV